MRRREFVTLLGGAAVAWPVALRAQQAERVRQIGVLMGIADTDAEGQRWLAVFQQALQQLGWTAGRNIRIHYRFAAGDAERLRGYAAELTRLSPDVILAHSPPVLVAVQRETRTVPIVFLGVADPVGGGFVTNLAHPEGNTTGFTNYEFTLGGKWLEVLREVAPGVTRVLTILNPDNPTGPKYVQTIEALAPSLGVQLTTTSVPDPAHYERAIEAFAREANGGLILLPDFRTSVHREQILALAARHRLPAVYSSRYFAAGGGLLSYGPDATDPYRRAASYVDRILKGAKPGDLPVEAPTKFELVINLKTAKALGLTVPPILLARADEVIE